MSTTALFVQLATESQRATGERRVSTRVVLSERICSQERFFTQTVELVVGAGATHAVFDTPDDDGVAAVLASEFGDAIES